MTRLKILYAATVLCLLPVLLPAQTKPAQDGWEPFRFFVGEWEGTGARETYKLLSADEFIKTFELAEPGKDFEKYTENRYRRKK